MSLMKPMTMMRLREPAEAAELEELQAPNHWPKDFAAKFEALDAASAAFVHAAL
jgi:hypothetical protein